MTATLLSGGAIARNRTLGAAKTHDGRTLLSEARATAAARHWTGVGYDYVFSDLVDENFAPQGVATQSSTRSP